MEPASAHVAPRSCALELVGRQSCARRRRERIAHPSSSPGRPVDRWFWRGRPVDRWFSRGWIARQSYAPKGSPQRVRTEAERAWSLPPLAVQGRMGDRKLRAMEARRFAGPGLGCASTPSRREPLRGNLNRPRAKLRRIARRRTRRGCRSRTDRTNAGVFQPLRANRNRVSRPAKPKARDLGAVLWEAPMEVFRVRGQQNEVVSLIE